MWWMFEKRKETENFVEYAYSRGDRSLDGLLLYDKLTEKVSAIRPCSSDKTPPNSPRYAFEHIYTLKEAGFPDRRQIACG